MRPKTFTLAQNEVADPDSGEFGVVAVFRRRSGSRIEVGAFLVDRSCLGVRDAWYEETDESGFEEIKEELFSGGCVEKDGPWGRKLVEGAVEYARQLGFKPNRAYKKAARVFGGIKAEDCAERFAYGRDGKPFFIPSETDSPETIERILRQLEVRCGKGNFHYAGEHPDDPLRDRVDLLLEGLEKGFSREVEVEAKLRKLLKEDPSSGIVHFGLGVTAIREGEFERALAHLNEAVRFSPEMAEAWFNKGITHRELGEIVPMALALRKAVECADGDERFAESAEDLLKEIEKVARDEFDLDLDTYLQAGMIFDQAFPKMSEGKWTEAISDFRKVIQLNPHSYQAHGNIGTCFTQLGKIADARAALQEALRISPDYAVARRNLKLLESVDENNPGPPLPYGEVNSATDDLK